MTGNSQIAADSLESFPRDRIFIQTKTGKEYLFIVELAMTSQQRSQGLMNRTSLENRSGMLFLYPTLKRRSFWMKNTPVALDMIFLDQNGLILYIHHNASPQDTKLITPKVAIKAVLEINAGVSTVLGIQKGDSVLHPFFRNIIVK